MIESKQFAAKEPGMKHVLFVFVFCFALLPATAQNKPAPPNPKKPVSGETRMKNQLRDRLCKNEDIKNGPGCEKVKSIFADSRFTLYGSAPGAAPPPPSKNPKGNPYFTTSFGLLTPTSLEHCREVYARYQKIFDDTERIYGVPKEFICARLRIETNFGKAEGTNSVVNNLYTLYTRSARRREFAFHELRDFLLISENLGWDALAIKGSPTGAFGLSQHEPSSYMNPRLVADGDGDGKIDLFTYGDAIPSIAAHDKACGWSQDPQDQFNAIYCYNHSTDYVDAVRVYAWVVKIYLELKPIDPPPMIIPETSPLPMRENEIELLNSDPPTRN